MDQRIARGERGAVGPALHLVWVLAHVVVARAEADHHVWPVAHRLPASDRVLAVAGDDRDVGSHVVLRHVAHVRLERGRGPAARPREDVGGPRVGPEQRLDGVREPVAVGVSGPEARDGHGGEWEVGRTGLRSETVAAHEPERGHGDLGARVPALERDIALRRALRGRHRRRDRGPLRAPRRERRSELPPERAGGVEEADEEVGAAGEAAVGPHPAANGEHLPRRAGDLRRGGQADPVGPLRLGQPHGVLREVGGGEPLNAPAGAAVGRPSGREQPPGAQVRVLDQGRLSRRLGREERAADCRGDHQHLCPLSLSITSPRAEARTTRPSRTRSSPASPSPARGPPSPPRAR